MEEGRLRAEMSSSSRSAHRIVTVTSGRPRLQSLSPASSTFPPSLLRLALILHPYVNGGVFASSAEVGAAVGKDEKWCLRKTLRHKPWNRRQRSYSSVQKYKTSTNGGNIKQIYFMLLSQHFQSSHVSSSQECSDNQSGNAGNDHSLD